MNSWFEKLVGKENISDDAVDREAYSTDGSQIRGNAQMVLWVNNTKEVHHILLYAKRNKMDVVPRGAGTSHVGGTVPFNSIVIDFSKMNNFIIEKDRVIAEPGVILDHLNNCLGDKFFPIIPENSAVCTIGGMCGINATGIYERKYGRMSDWIEEVEMIDGLGRLRKYGNEVIGTEGVVGVITKVTLKLTDKIIENSMDIFKFQKIEDVVSKLAHVQFHKNILAIEFISLSAAILSGLEAKHYLIIEYEGLEGDIKDYDEIRRICTIRKNVFQHLAEKGFIYREDAYVPLDNMAELLFWLENKGVPSFGSVGSGYVFPCFDERKDVKEFYGYMKEIKVTVGCVFGYDLLKKEFVPDEMRDKIKAMKAELDPHEILNMGKVI